MEATTKDLRLHTRELLAATDRGEPVYIRWRGRRRAVLVRWDEDSDTKADNERNPAFGLWRDRPEDVETQVRTLRQPRDLP